MPQTIPIACSLDQAELPGRAKLMQELGGTLTAVEANGLRASLTFRCDRSRVEDFVAAESGCCPFFEFEVAEAGETTSLSVGAPEGGEWAVRGLVAGFVAGWGELV